MRTIDQLLALGILIIGAIHIWTGLGVFLAPAEDAVWFLSAGLLGVVAGFANLARTFDKEPHAFGVIAAVVGSLSVVLIGVLLAMADPSLLGSPASLSVLALGAGSLAFGVRDMLAKR